MPSFSSPNPPFSLAVRRDRTESVDSQGFVVKPPSMPSLSIVIHYSNLYSPEAQIPRIPTLEPSPAVPRHGHGLSLPHHATPVIRVLAHQGPLASTTVAAPAIFILEASSPSLNSVNGTYMWYLDDILSNSIIFPRRVVTKSLTYQALPPFIVHIG